jgi:hypothetical protein
MHSHDKFGGVQGAALLTVREVPNYAEGAIWEPGPSEYLFGNTTCEKKSALDHNAAEA